MCHVLLCRSLAAQCRLFVVPFVGRGWLQSGTVLFVDLWGARVEQVRVLFLELMPVSDTESLTSLATYMTLYFPFFKHLKKCLIVLAI